MFVLLLTVVVAASAAAVLAKAAGPPGGFPRFPSGCARSDFSSSGMTVRAELCAPSGAGTKVVAVVLHGCGGFSTFDHRLATELPRYGIATFDVDYFALTPPPGRRGFCVGGGSPAEAMPAWLRTTNAAAAYLRERMHIKSVLLAGWSLGADVAQATVSMPPGDRLFVAVAAFSPAGPPLPEPRHAPPAIFLYASKNDLNPAWMTRLTRRREPTPAGLAIYVEIGGTHTWKDIHGTLGIAAAAAFLRAHVGLQRAPLR